MVTKRTLAMATLVGCLAWPVCGQQSSSSSGQSPQGSSDSQSSSGSPSQEQKQGGSRKSSTEENQFPQEQSQKAAEQQNAPAPGPGPATSPAADNPFPEAQSEAAAKAAGSSSNASSGVSNSDAPNSGTSSSSSSSSSSADPWDSTSNPNPANPDGGLPPDAGRRRLGKPSEGDIESGSLTAEWKAKEDIKVGHFYLDTGDYAGAYGRFSDAARLDPTSIDAIYGLARAAEGVHKKQEALANYQLYLSIAPDGRDARSARKAVQSLSR